MINEKLEKARAYEAGRREEDHTTDETGVSSDAASWLDE